MRILLTSNGYQDTPGEHHAVLARSGLDVVLDRGPLSEAKMLDLIATYGGFDGLLCGDDQITAKVIDAGLAAPASLKVISKYGIGLDAIDIDYATANRIPVLFTPGVNHTTVAEHTIGLMVAAAKHFAFHFSAMREGQWKRKTGLDLMGKTLGIVGFGRIGKEVAKRANAFGMTVMAYDPAWDVEAAQLLGVTQCETFEALLGQSDVVTLHLPLTDATHGMINANAIEQMRDGAMLINVARGGLVDEQAVAEACRSGKLYGYATDVMQDEPVTNPHPFTGLDNVAMTPHLASRTVESVCRQALRATHNLVNFFAGNDDVIQANAW